MRTCCAVGAQSDSLVALRCVRVQVRLRSVITLEATRAKAQAQTQRLQTLVAELQDAKQKAIAANGSPH